MGRMRKIFAGFLPLCLACTLWAGQVSAAEPYTYQVTFYPGNHGAFTGANHVNVGRVVPTIRSALRAMPS